MRRFLISVILGSLLCVLGSCGDDDPVSPTDTTPPQVTATSPAHGAQLVAVTTDITVTFSEAMNPASLNSTAFSLTPTTVAGSLSYTDNVLTFAPDEALDTNVTYTATVTTAAKDIAGNALASDYFWEFTTSTAAVVSPIDNGVIGDSVLIEVEAGNIESIDSVQFYIDGSMVTGATDVAAPFEYYWDASALELGSVHYLNATVYDSSGNVDITDSITVHYLWQLIIADDTLETDGRGVIPRDLRNIYARSTNELLQLRVETTRGWNNYKDPAEGIDVALFLDVDQNNHTGADDVSGGTIDINDIGADYRIIVGNHGDSLAHWWGNQVDGYWDGVGLIDSIEISNYSNFFEIDILLSRLGNTNIFDLVAANVILEPEPYRWDWAPNQGEGHATYRVDHSFVLPSTAASPPRMEPSSVPVVVSRTINNPFD